MKKYKTIIADPPWKYKGRGPASAKEHRPNSYGAAPSSVKPEWFYDLVDRCSFADKLEMFSRRERNGWDCFGNQVENSIDLSPYYR